MKKYTCVEEVKDSAGEVVALALMSKDGQVRKFPKEEVLSKIETGQITVTNMRPGEDSPRYVESGEKVIKSETDIRRFLIVLFGVVAIVFGGLLWFLSNIPG